MSSDIQAIQNQALGAVKQAEEDAFLETMRKKAEQQKIQQEHQRQKIQEFHRQDQQLQDTQKTQDQYKVELKAIEQAAKLLNIQPENLQPQNIKDVLPLLQQAEIEALQRILETQDLQNIQKRYKEAKLEDQGIKQKFSNELQLLQSISKALNIPVEKLTQGQIQAFLKKNKSEQFIPRKQQVNVNSKQLNSNDQLDRSSRVAARLTQLKGLLESLGSKQEEILRQMGQNKNLKRELDKVTQQIAKLDIKLNQLRDELLAKPDESQENILLKESVAAAKRDIQEMRQKKGSIETMLPTDNDEVSKTEQEISQLKDLQTTLQKKLYDRRDSMPSKLFIDAAKQSIEEQKTALISSQIIQKEIKGDGGESKDNIQSSIKSLNAQQALLGNLISQNEDLSLSDISKRIKTSQLSDNIKEAILQNINVIQNRQALINVLDSTNESANEIPVDTLNHLLNLPVSILSHNQLSKFQQIVEANLALVSKLQEHNAFILKDNLFLGSKSLGQWINDINGVPEKQSIRSDLTAIKDTDGAKLSPPSQNKSNLNQPMSIWVDRFDVAKTQGEQSLAPIINDLRKLQLKQSPEFFLIIKQLLDRQLISPKDLENDFGLVVGESGIGADHEGVKPEAIQTMLRLLNIPSDTSPELLPPLVQDWISKERLSRSDFEAVNKSKVSQMSWDFGLVRFNEGSVGLLRERADLNSFAHFEAWINDLAGGDIALANKMEKLFLSKESFTLLERDLSSLFLSEYEDFIIDPTHPFHDLYSNYLSTKTFSQLDHSDREELAIGVLLRLIATIDCAKPHDVLKQYLSLAEQPENSPSFQRFLEITDYVFSEGGAIKAEFLDLNIPLQFVQEETTWDEEKEKRVAMYTVSEMVKGMSIPVKQSPKIKLRSLADRLKDQIKH